MTTNIHVLVKDSFNHAISLMQDLANMDADELLKKQVEQMEKDRREKETKQKTQEKKACLELFPAEVLPN